MKRNRPPIVFKKADAILSADWHIRPDTPTCRTDNFFTAQEKKIDFIFALANKNDCPILVAGDLGHKPLNNGWPTWLLEWFIKKVKTAKVDIIIIPGQHDLPNHRLDLFPISGIGVLEAAGIIKIIGVITVNNEILGCHLYPKSTEKYGFKIVPFPYGTPIKPLGQDIDYEMPNISMIAMTHQMVIEDNVSWPGQQASTGYALLKQFPEYDLILSGDNHIPFTAEYEGRILVNPGSIMRTTADQVNYTPRIYLWYANENRVESVYLPIEQDVISRTHIEIAEKRDKRMEAYAIRAREDVEIELSYPDNLTRYFNKHRTQGRVKTKVWEAVG